MLKLVIPYIENIQTKDPSLVMNNYHLYSSIFEPFPQLNITYDSPYGMPDVLGTYLGTSFPLQYQIVYKKTNSETEETEQEEDLPVDFPGLFVKNIQVKGGTSLQTTITCTSEFEFTQNSDIRKAYIAKYGNEIVEDVLNSNNTVKEYDRNIQKTNNAFTSYRALGESDIDFIRNTCCKKYTIFEGTPFFYIGLDRKINYTSINNLIEAKQKAKVLIKSKGIALDDSYREEYNNLVQNYVDENGYTELIADNFELNVGKGVNDLINIKNAVYYTNYNNGLVSTNGYIFKPAQNSKQYYPISKIFNTFSNASASISVFNRPADTVIYETQNMFDIFEDMISIKATISDISSFDHLVLAGDTVTFLFPYPFSIYNGNYILASIEYGQEKASTFAEVLLIKDTLDFNWQDMLVKVKDNEDFKFPYAPTIQKSTVYSI